MKEKTKPGKNAGELATLLSYNVYAILTLPNLCHRTSLPAAPVGERSVLVPVPIAVQRGDFIGIFYPRNVQNNVIAQAQLADDVVPASEMFQNYYVQFFDDMVSPGSNFNINSLPFTQNNATFAIRALVNYADEGGRPQSVCLFSFRICILR